MLVSAIMPTRGRPDLAAQAVRCFLSQNYTPRELLILDDIDDPSFPRLHVLPHDRSNPVRYWTVSERRTIGWKRNELIQAANGDVIIHWDSDDWSSPERIMDQVEQLAQSGKAVGGFKTLLFADESKQKAWRYYASEHQPVKVVGTSLVYRKPFWERNRFPERMTQNGIVIPEENDLINAANQAGDLRRMDGRGLMVARIHAENTVQKTPDVSPEQYRSVDWSEIPQGFFDT